MRKSLLLVVVCLLAGAFMAVNPVQASWAYSFVVNDGKIYVLSEVHVEPEQIGDKVGKVTSYSDEEGTYSGNFSNSYPKGTEYFAVHGIDINEAIAIKISDESYLRANYEGEYEGNRFSWKKGLLYLGGLFLLVMAVLFVKNNWKPIQ
ncbi:hypothetical protein [Paenibacillus sp. PL91]|uniref:hypothetical protein n=1 Tax=Paenibacillus sp. PL91 TaxID=2729538 RepID=UPI001CB8DBDE|nr:hypothetical protein [Paenibacillus sp. PL91]